MKETTEELDNSIVIPNESNSDVKDELIGDQINRTMMIRDICSNLEPEQLDELIRYGKEMIK